MKTEITTNRIELLSLTLRRRGALLGAALLAVLPPARAVDRCRDMCRR